MFRLRHSKTLLNTLFSPFRAKVCGFSLMNGKISQSNFCTASDDLKRQLLKQEMKENTEDMKAGELYKQKSEQEEFFGVPLEKGTPENTEQVIAKLRMRFSTPDSLLSFYEDSRKHFQGKIPNKFCRQRGNRIFQKEINLTLEI